MNLKDAPGSTIFLEGSYPVQYENQPPFYPQSVIFDRATPTEDKVKLFVTMGHLPCSMEVDPETFAKLPATKGENLDFRS